jgi:hypothetical protein
VRLNKNHLGLWPTKYTSLEYCAYLQPCDSHAMSISVVQSKSKFYFLDLKTIKFILKKFESYDIDCMTEMYAATSS